MAAVTDDSPFDLRGVVLADRFEAVVAFTVEPGFPVPGVYLQNRLQFLVATTDAALNEGHGLILFEVL